MRNAWLIVGLCLASPLYAQDEPPMVENLRRQVVERFVESYRTQAGLTPEQDQRFRHVVQSSFERRRQLEQQERALWRSLEGQMRPGVAANADTVSRALDGLLEVQQARLEGARADQREYATFLTPVQRAQLALMWARFERQVEQVMQRRMQMQGRPGAQGRIPPL